MNRSPRARLSALLAAVLFLLSGAGDAFGAHPCPHHGAIAAPDFAVRGADHHGHAAHDPAAPAEHDGHDACTCGGICPVSGGPAPLAAPAIAFLLLAPPAAAPAAHPDPTGLPSRLAAHLLPFAQAPPPSA